MRGSSPLARGTQVLLSSNAAPNRLIPARAGNTCWVRSWLLLSAAHPRSRGEHSALAPLFLVAVGSSPLARGTHPDSLSPDSDHRLIPARAGNTMSNVPVLTAQTAHPRSRGEHSGVSLPGLSLHGSSPLARGTPSAMGELAGWLRLIPARAGNTHS